MIKIGAMDLGVARNTGDLWLVKVTHTMTFHTEGSGIAANQQELIRRSMGEVTDAASFHLDGLVFKNPGPSLFRMAFEADIVVESIPFLQAGPVPGIVRGMAVRTENRSLQHPVTGGKIKLGPNLRVAGKTQVRLFAL